MSEQVEKSILLPMVHYEEMQKDIACRYPEEACGLVAGERGVVAKIIPVENELHSPIRFRMVVSGLIQSFQIIDSLHLDLLAIYHSHPTGPSGPSAIDIAEAFYPEAISLIWSLDEGGWSCHGYCIQNGIVQGVEIRLQ